MLTVNLAALTTSDLIRRGRGIVAGCFRIDRKALVRSLYRRHVAARMKSAAALPNAA